MSELPKLQAAQYLRMSTEHQRYSLASQADTIAQYAAVRGYEINRTYFDPGKSGLTLRERGGLQALLSDALRADREFDAILVLDVSRWGRFQDLDQSAHYEFLCREAGLEVIYCAEPFENDGSAITAIVKQLKRLMAAEYSRELSAKVTRARLHQAQLGFHQGGTRVYGVRRVIVDAHGHTRFIPGPGERKWIRTDRVVLMPGPPKELSVVRRMFRRFVDDKWTMTEIAAELNRQGVPASNGAAWHPKLVRSVLSNELMVGVYVFNRTHRTLRSPRKPNPPEAWVRVKVMDAIVSPGLFRRAQARLATRAREKFDRRRMLAGLRRLLGEQGYLDWRNVTQCPYLPEARTYLKYFGGLTAAYREIGYVPYRKRWRSDAAGKPTKNEELLCLLRGAYERHGYLTSILIDQDPKLPSTYIVRDRFGTISRAYQLAGLPHMQKELQQGAYRRSVALGRPSGRKPIVDSPTQKEALLEALRGAFARNGFVSAQTLKDDQTLPSPKTLSRCFGSLLSAYELAGLPSSNREILSAAARRRCQRLAADARRRVARAGAQAMP